MNKKLIAGAGLLGLGLLSCAAASTTEVQPYTIVAWEMPSYIDATTPTWAQIYATSSAISAVDVNALDNWLANPAQCGKQYQIDTYNTSAVTDALIAGGHLDGPGNPTEDFPANSGWGVTYKLVKTADCAAVVPPVEPPVVAPPVVDLAPPVIADVPAEPVLASTGADWVAPSLFGGALLSLGLGLTVIRKRRES